MRDEKITLRYRFGEGAMQRALGAWRRTQKTSFGQRVITMLAVVLGLIGVFDFISCRAETCLKWGAAV